MTNNSATEAAAGKGWTGQKCPHCKGTGENLSNPMNSGSCEKCGGTGDEYAAAPTPGEARFYIDHGMIHDRVTGKHVVTDGEWPFEDDLPRVLELLNSLTPPQAATEIASLRERVKELERDCAEAYQVVGTLAGAHDDLFNDPQVIKALDNLSAATAPMDKRPHDDLLPFAPITVDDPLARLEARAETAERERDMLGEVIEDTARELGCKSDNEEILFAIDKLRRERDEARAALKPFGSITEFSPKGDGEVDRIEIEVSIDDIDRAARAITGED